eukprot:gene7185-11497_t
MNLDAVLNLLDFSKFVLVLVNIYILFYIVYFKKVEKQDDQEIKAFLKEKKNIGIIIAHPDDESMFFTPTITSISKYTNLHLLCLSSGNFDGIGETRKKELEKSSTYLNFKSFKIIEDDSLQDGMKNHWKKEIISSEIEKFQKEHDVDMIISFDDYGVSGHPNHINTYKGTFEFLKKNPEIIGFKLTSCSIYRKYIGLFDVIIWFFYENENDNNYTFFSPLIFNGYNSMSKYQSQFIWFRKLFILFSKYSYVNTIQKIKI